jgi:hypothetical protein
MSGENRVWIFCALACGRFFGSGIQTSSWLRVRQIFPQQTADSFARVYSKNDTAVDMQFASKGGCTCEMLRLFVRAQRCTSKTPNDHDPG